MLQKFTSELYDLYVNSNLGLIESLKIMNKKPGKKNLRKSKGLIQETAGFLLLNLEKGNLLSNAMKACTYITFDDLYISFISMAEKTGKLKEAIIYLKEKCNRDKTNREKLISVFLYPVVVLIFAFIICIFICTYFDQENKMMILKAFFWFFIFCVGILILIKKNLGESKLYEAFLAIGFLVDSGMSISLAVECGSRILGVNSKLGKQFLIAKKRLEYGMDLQNAFCMNDAFNEAFYYADSAGNKSKVFSNIAIWMSNKYEKKRKLILSLIEPLFIVFTGVFLIILTIKFFMPFMTDFSWM